MTLLSRIKFRIWCGIKRPTLTEALNRLYGKPLIKLFQKSLDVTRPLEVPTIPGKPQSTGKGYYFEIRQPSS